VKIHIPKKKRKTVMRIEILIGVFGIESKSYKCNIASERRDCTMASRMHDSKTSE
jgi:hypothetical protein